MSRPHLLVALLIITERPTLTIQALVVANVIPSRSAGRLGQQPWEMIEHATAADCEIPIAGTNFGLLWSFLLASDGRLGILDGYDAMANPDAQEV